MEYLLYEIKNNINGKIYVGVHRAKIEDDGYMGSGKIICRAIEKHGIENFTKTILERFDSAEAMFAREKEIVTDEFLARTDVYNLRRGGYGGFDLINKTITQEEKRKMALEGYEKSKARGTVNNKLQTDEVKEKARIGRSLNVVRNKSFLGKKHTEISKEKISKAMTGKGVADTNSQFGSMWITNGIENKKIKKDSLIPKGWYKGRI